MNLKITYSTKPIDVLGLFEPQPIWAAREVFIDDKKVPEGLARIILAGLDSMTEEYLKKIEKLMEDDGYEFKRL
jgi:hypothetical protein